MNTIPWFSTFTLVTETFVTASVIYIFIKAYKENKFNFKLTAITLGYEILFNISYMVYRAASHEESAASPESGLGLFIAIFHGIFSLIMFIALIVFMYTAWKNYRKGINYFREHKTLSTVFMVAWMLAILSGFVFYYEEYMTPKAESVSPTMSVLR